MKDVWNWIIVMSLTAGLGPASFRSPIRSATDGPRADLCPELESLRPFLGNWVGHFDEPGETMEILTAWTPMLDGQAVRETRAIAEGGFSHEKILYFDRTAGGIAYLVITNNGYVSRGRLAFDRDRFVSSGEQILPDGSVQSTSGSLRFTETGTLVEQGGKRDADGAWLPSGHTIIFSRR